jgi:hypothetical protein
MDNFNFEAVHNHMISVNWEWANGGWGRTNKVPTVDELRDRAKSLLIDVANSDLENSSSSTGGFHAHKWNWGELELVFAIEVWHAPTE